MLRPAAMSTTFHERDEMLAAASDRVDIDQP
jgi:hypothetical protein